MYDFEKLRAKFIARHKDTDLTNILTNGRSPENGHPKVGVHEEIKKSLKQELQKLGKQRSSQINSSR